MISAQFKTKYPKYRIFYRLAPGETFYLNMDGNDRIYVKIDSTTLDEMYKDMRKRRTGAAYCLDTDEITYDIPLYSNVMCVDITITIYSKQYQTNENNPLKTFITTPRGINELANGTYFMYKDIDSDVETQVLYVSTPMYGLDIVHGKCYTKNKFERCYLVSVDIAADGANGAITSGIETIRINKPFS